MKEWTESVQRMIDWIETHPDQNKVLENLSDESRHVLSTLAYKEYRDHYSEEANYKMLLEIYKSVNKK